MTTGATTYSMKTRKHLGDLEMHLQADRNVPCTIGSLDFSGRIVCGSHNGYVHIWDVPSNELVQSLKLDGTLSLWVFCCMTESSQRMAWCNMLRSVALFTYRCSTHTYLQSQSYLDKEYVAGALVDGAKIIKVWKATIRKFCFSRQRRR